MMRILAVILVVVATLFVLAPKAHAETLGSLTYTIPSGWDDTPSRREKLPPWRRLLGDNQGDMITIDTHGKGGDARTVAINALPTGSVLKEAAVAVAGAQGYVVVEQAGQKIYASGAAMTSDGAVVIWLSSTQANWDAAAQAWGALVDGASLSSASAEQNDGDYSDHGDQPTQYTITLKNQSTGCTAAMSVDDQSYTIDSGAQVQVQVAAGKHVFKYQNGDGSSGERTLDVPNAGTTFTTACRAEKADAQQASDDNDTSMYTDDQLVEGAQYFVVLWIVWVNVVEQRQLQVTEKLLNAVAPKIATAARGSKPLADYLVALPAAVPQAIEQYKNADEAARYQMVRAAAKNLQTLAPKAYPQVAACSAGDEIDCFILADRKRAKQQATTEDVAAQNILSVTLKEKGDPLL
jgi:hypothetical protein